MKTPITDNASHVWAFIKVLSSHGSTLSAPIWRISLYSSLQVTSAYSRLTSACAHKFCATSTEGLKCYPSSGRAESRCPCPVLPAFSRSHGSSNSGQSSLSRLTNIGRACKTWTRQVDVIPAFSRGCFCSRVVRPHHQVAAGNLARKAG